MADFSQFEGAQQEEDPAADFLAREQDQLAELGGDDFITSNDVDQSESHSVPQQNGEVSDDMFGSQPPMQNTGDFFLDEAVENGYTAVGNDDMADIFGLATDQQENGSAEQDAYAEIKRVDELRAEPEKLKRWREEQKELLEKKDSEAEAKAVEWSAIAAKELEDWYKHRKDQLEKNMKNNREAEAAFVEERDDSVPGHEWERICRLCEFNPKGGARSSKDVSRMRSILLQLKQTPLVR